MTAKPTIWARTPISIMISATTGPTNSWKWCSATGIPWQDGSLLINKKNGRFADPDKVKRLDHNGKFFKSRGPFTVPRSQQGHPVIIQAGASGRGQRFAGRWGEVIFTAARNLAGAKQGYDAIRNEAAKAGRDPDQMFLCNLM